MWCPLFLETLYLEITILKDYGITFMSNGHRCWLLYACFTCWVIAAWALSPPARSWLGSVPHSSDILVPETKARPGTFVWLVIQDRMHPLLGAFSVLLRHRLELCVVANWKKHKKKDGIEDIIIHQITMLICIVCLVDAFKLKHCFFPPYFVCFWTELVHLKWLNPQESISKLTEVLTAHAVLHCFKQPLQLFNLQPPAIYIGQLLCGSSSFLLTFSISLEYKSLVLLILFQHSTAFYTSFIRESSRKISLTLVAFLASLTQAASLWLTNHSPAFIYSVWWILYYNCSLKSVPVFWVFFEKIHSDRINKSTHEKNVILRHI